MEDSAAIIYHTRAAACRMQSILPTHWSSNNELSPANSLMGCHCGIPNPLRKPYRSTTEVKGAKGSSKRWLANAPSKTLEQQYEEKWSTTLRVECNSELAPLRLHSLVARAPLCWPPSNVRALDAGYPMSAATLGGLCRDAVGWIGLINRCTPDTWKLLFQCGYGNEKNFTFTIPWTFVHWSH